FGYSAPHPSAEGTLTPMIHALPSAQYELIRPCAPLWYSRLVGSPLGLLPYHQNDRFSCSALKPVLSSCPLYADCRFACYASSHQSSSQARPRSLVLTVSIPFRHLIRGSFAFISSIRT